MIPKEQFKSLADKMMSDLFAGRKDQLLIYQTEGMDLIDDLYEGRRIDEKNITVSLESATTYKEAIECLTIILSTFDMLKLGYKVFLEKKNNNNEELREIKKAWKDQLIENKIDEKLADKIVKEFVNDVRSMIK